MAAGRREGWRGDAREGDSHPKVFMAISNTIPTLFTIRQCRAFSHEIFAARYPFNQCRRSTNDWNPCAEHA